MVTGHEGVVNMNMDIHAYGGYAQPPGGGHMNIFAWVYEVESIYDTNSCAWVQ